MKSHISAFTAKRLSLSKECLISIILFSIIISGIWESILGWEQLLGFKRSNHSLYPATGTFYNPGPYCSFLALILPIALAYLLKKGNKILLWISYIYLLLSIPLLPVLMGRTGWIAAILGCMFVLYKAEKIPHLTNATKIYSSILFLIFTGFLIYIKPASALGRLLIWRNGLTALKNNLLTGSGWDCVAGELGMAQEKYFELHPSSIYESVAGSPQYAFNEFLQIGIAFGIFGLTAFLLLLSFAIYTSSKSKRYGITGSLIAFILISLSSYPLQFIEFIIISTLLIIASILSYSNIRNILSLPIIGVLLIISTYSCIKLNERWKDSQNWKYLQYAYRYTLSEKDIIYLDSIVSKQSWNSNLIFDYGKSLRNNGLFEKSTDILMKGERKSSDPMFLNLIGRNYQDMGNPAKAEEFYLRSTHRLPGRLYPYYLLAKLYTDSASFDSVKFRKVYNIAIRMQPKVDSPAISEMKQELKLLNDSIIPHIN